MEIKTISLTECSRMLESGRRLDILDVRTPAEFDRVHATGARLIPLDALDPAAILAASGTDPVYVICQSGGRAAKACQRLETAGLKQVFSIEGGTAAWEKAGLPVQRGGGKVISLERQVRISAGLLVLTGTILAFAVHPAFLVIPAFVGSGLVFAGVTDFCGMGMALAKMPWNRRSGAQCAMK